MKKKLQLSNSDDKQLTIIMKLKLSLVMLSLLELEVYFWHLNRHAAKHIKHTLVQRKPPFRSLANKFQ